MLVIVIEAVLIFMAVISALMIGSLYGRKKAAHEYATKYAPIGDLMVVDDDDGRHMFLELDEDANLDQSFVIFMVKHTDSRKKQSL